MRVGTTFSVIGLVVAALGPSIAACGSSDGEAASESASDAGGGIIAFADGDTPTKTYSPDDLWKDDPPPPWCGPANGKPAPPPPGGTPECPDDKNREGCACKTVGETAACWPGLRVNRGLGACKDGTTTCLAKGELDKAWGPCEGFVMPTAGATKGKEACKCFSAGQWKIDNLIPCYVNNNGTYYATSAQCPTNQTDPPPPNSQPSTPWSKNTLTVDCAGHFKLCYSIKVGDAKNPQPSDCTLTTVCTEADYVEANKPQAFPDLGGWVSQSSASTCIPGIIDPNVKAPTYGEMTVIGKSVICDEISDNGQPLVFNRVPYCAIDCSANPTRPDCATCQAAGSGGF
jgi:hypothetical protein